MNTEDIKKNINKKIEDVKRISKKIGETIKEIKETVSFDFFDYIEKYGDYTFEEKEFNEIDNLIFATLAYVNYNGIVSEKGKNKKTINEVSKEYFSSHTKEETKKYFSGMKTGIKLLEKISDKKRYKDILVFNYLYKSNYDSQFSAITFDLGNRVYYVAYEGTDILVSGWKEDCEMAYAFPVEAHKLAKKYLRKYTFKNIKLIIGGHSKGGNLALVASMYTNFLNRWKILKIYNNDGQGLRKKQLNSWRYKRIEKKYIHIIPDSSIVGLLLRHKDNYIVIKSNMPGIVSHDPKTWQIRDDEFLRTKLSRFSRVFDEGFSKWLDKYDDEQREKFVTSVFAILRENEIITLLQFTENYKLIFSVLKSSKKVDPIVKEMGMDLLKVITQTNLEYPLFK